LVPSRLIVPSFSTPARWREQEHLHEEFLQFRQEGAPKHRKRIVVGMQIARDEAKGHYLIGSTLNLARTEHPGGIAIQ
jgi:hypothetical protein